MGFSIFGKSGNSDSNSVWKPITQELHIEAVKEASKDSPQLIFKHSTSCFISKTVLNNFVAEWNKSKFQNSLHLLDLLSYRSLSNNISAMFDVVHQSPQVIVIHKGEAIYHASHQGIDANEIAAVMSQSIE